MGLREDILALPADLRAQRDTQAIADALNAAGRTKLVSRQVSARTVLAELPISGAVTGAGVLDKLEAAGASIPAVKWAVRFLQLETGLDVGHPNTQAMLTVLASANVLTTAEADALKALAFVPDLVSEFEVRQVCFAGNGDWSV